jgi:RecB family exonuclease
MARIDLIRVPLGADVTRRVATMLRDAARKAKPFAAAPVIYVASNERRAKLVSRLACESYPEGTPDRVARELLKVFAPAIHLRGEIERDFDLFAAVSTALSELGENRRVGRPVVEEALSAWKRLAQAVPPGDRASVPWTEALGERGELFLEIARHYAARLREVRQHDPEDALWIAAEAMVDWPLKPALVVIDDLDRVTPARAAFVKALLDRAERALVIVAGSRDQLPFLAHAHESMQDCVLARDGSVVPEGEVDSRPNQAVVRAWLEDVPVRTSAISVLRPPTRAAEVREAVRAIKRAAHDGVALSDICVAMPSTARYREVIEEEFTAAGVPFDAPFEIALNETAPVAALLDLLRAARGGLDRTTLLDALSSPFLRFSAKSEAARREIMSSLQVMTREAWVVGGTDAQRDWVRKLEGRHGWSDVREPLLPVLTALQPFTRRSLRAVAFMEAVQALLMQSRAPEVAAEDRRGGEVGAGLREDALHRFSTLLREMGAEFRRVGNPELSVSDLLRALSEQTAARSVRRPEAAADRVRVLGLRELRGVSFRRVICLGLTDRDLPLAEEEAMFLPASREDAVAAVAGKDLARELCAPIDTAAQADYLFAHLLLAANERLTLSLPGSEDDTPFVPATQLARLLRCMGLEKLAETAGGEIPASAGELAAAAARGLASVEGGGEATADMPLAEASLIVGLRGRRLELARTDLASAPGEYEGVVGPLDGLAEQFDGKEGKRHLFSPSQLDTYAECPIRFWSRYVMRVKSPEEPTLDTPPHAIGTLLHATFERWVLLLRAHANQPAVLDDPVARQPIRLLQLAADENAARALGLRLMAEAFDHACADNPTEGPFWEGVKALVGAGLPGRDNGRGEGLLARFVDAELERNRAGMGVRFVEFNFGKATDTADESRPDTMQTPIELDIPGGSIMLLGSIDRVDEGPEGLEIVDYKTGGAHTTAEVRDGRAFQLPVYLAAVSKLTGRAPRGMSYLRVPPDGVIKRVDVTQLYGKPAYDIGELVFTQLPERLSRIVRGLKSGVFMHLPFASSSACGWCDYAGACARRTEVIEERQHRLLTDDQPEVAHVYLPDREQP